MSASESFQMRVNSCTILLDKIKIKIKERQGEQKKSPLNWGFSGSMFHTQELLERTLESL